VSDPTSRREARLTGDVPQDVSFTINGLVVKAFLDTYAIAHEASTDSQPIEKRVVAARGIAFTVHVDSCPVNRTGPVEGSLRGLVFGIVGRFSRTRFACACRASTQEQKSKQPTDQCATQPGAGQRTCPAWTEELVMTKNATNQQTNGQSKYSSHGHLPGARRRRIIAQDSWSRLPQILTGLRISTYPESPLSSTLRGKGGLLMPTYHLHLHGLRRENGDVRDRVGVCF